ncbi:hypothetical protein [Methanobacterium sp. BAmetb5]|uniref:hypothetical protein n=1 Tax=Methanobacterium sp. BAmetb5 TaxID=2025351 RepID=UPI000E9533CE|nr:hypothetical protein [Methanobacterium sp. BAmetb5]AXV40803.1 MAG: hypothetical protein CIT02_11010 [Methanobacterium sp. BAmetb5]
MNRSRMVIFILLVACLMVTASGFLVQSYLSGNNTTNLTNNTSTTAYNSTHNSSVDTSGDSHDSSVNPGEDNKPLPSGISADEARELAKKYAGPGTILGKPVRTTYKKIHAWQVPVYTRDHKFLNNIYIDAKNGRKVD